MGDPLYAFLGTSVSVVPVFGGRRKHFSKFRRFLISKSKKVDPWRRFGVFGDEIEQSGNRFDR